MPTTPPAALSEQTYWSALFGDRSAEDLVAEFGLVVDTRAGLDEWLGTCEAEAARQGLDLNEVQPAWRARALDAIEAAIAEVAA